MKTSQAVSLYNILKSLRVAKLPKEEQFKIIRAARALKATATAFDDFLADARERLKPEGFDDIIDKSRRFHELSEQEKKEVNGILARYQADVDECVRTELDKECTPEGIEPLAPDTLPILADTNDLTVDTLLLLEEM